MDSRDRPMPNRPAIPSIRKVDTNTLLASEREIILVHKDTEYRLRVTSNDKLILTK